MNQPLKYFKNVLHYTANFSYSHNDLKSRWCSELLLGGAVYLFGNLKGIDGFEFKFFLFMYFTLRSCHFCRL